jgi:hypothetical protein
MAAFVISAAITLFASANEASAQVRYSAEPRASLAWWQIDPHFGHLWATTCPADPSWQPGEGRSPQYYVDYIRRHDIKESGRRDARIPLYPRKRVRYVCKTAVSAVVEVADTASLRLVRAQVSVLADSLFTGLDMRDAYARKNVINTKEYPAIRFDVDSMTAVVPGDTIKAIAVGTFELRGVRVPMTSPVKIWREGGGIRVQSHFKFPANELVDVYQMSKLALGMGVRMGQWQEVHMGIDMLLMNPTSAQD